VVAGGALCARPLSVRYVDYASWQHHQVVAGAFRRQLDALARQLACPPERLDVLPRRARSGAPEAGARLPAIPTSKAELKRVGQPAGATVFMTLLAAYMIVLRAHTGREDVFVGVPMANRIRVGLDEVVGPFANTAVVRADITRQETFAAAMQATRAAMLMAYAHQEIPLELLAAPIDVLFGDVGTGDPTTRFTDLEASWLHLGEGAPASRLGLEVNTTQDIVEGSFFYGTRSIGRAEVEQLASHYAATLDAVMADPTMRVDDLMARIPKYSRRPWMDTPLRASNPGVDALPDDRIVRQLSQIWARALGVPEVGLDEDFFDLGGESLAALRLLSDVECTFGRRLPLATLLEAATITEMAARLRDEGRRR